MVGQKNPASRRGSRSNFEAVQSTSALAILLRALLAARILLLVGLTLLLLARLLSATLLLLAGFLLARITLALLTLVRHLRIA